MLTRLPFTLFMAIFWLISSPLLAQSDIKEGFSKLKKQKFEAARLLFEPAISDSEPANRTAAAWGLALVLADTSCTFHHFDSASLLCDTVRARLKNIRDTGAKKRLSKKPFYLDGQAITTLQRGISTAWLKEIESENPDLPSVFGWTVRNPKAAAKQKKLASRLLATLRRETLQKESDFQKLAWFYQSQLNWLRDSVPVSDKIGLENRLTEAFQKAHSMAEFPQFFEKLPDHPLSRHGSKTAFSKSLAQNSLPGYLDFLKKWPASPFSSMVSDWVKTEIAARPPAAAEVEKWDAGTKNSFDDLVDSFSSGLSVGCNTPFSVEKLAEWTQYFQRRAGKGCTFLKIREAFDGLLADRKCSELLALVRDNSPFFPEQKAWFDEKQALVGLPTTTALPVSLGAKINTREADEFSPIPTADGKRVYFCGSRRKGGLGNEDIFFADWNGTEWGEAQLDRELSSKGDESPKNISTDGNEIVFFLSGKLAVASREATGWSEPKGVPIDLSDFSWSSDMTFSPNGQVALFAAGSGAANCQIQISHKNADGTWAIPNALAQFKSRGTTRSPFIYLDGKTLYFSSNSLPGFGEMDVFRTTRLDNSWEKWSEPVNLGCSINGSGDDWGYRIGADGKTAWFSSVVRGSNSKDIFTITLPEEARPAIEMVPHSIQFNDETGKPVKESIRFEVLDKFTRENIGSHSTQPGTGKGTFFLPKNQSFMVSPQTPGFYAPPMEVGGSEPINTAIAATQITLRKVMDGGSTELSADVIFETGQFELKPESAARVGELSRFVIREKLTIILTGHTDAVGGESANLELSRKRAEMVRSRLLENGLAADSVQAVGLGETQLKCLETTDACNGINRRVEISWRKK